MPTTVKIFDIQEAEHFWNIMSKLILEDVQCLGSEIDHIKQIDRLCFFHYKSLLAISGNKWGWSVKEKYSGHLNSPLRLQISFKLISLWWFIGRGLFPLKFIPSFLDHFFFILFFLSAALWTYREVLQDSLLVVDLVFLWMDFLQE